MQRTLAWMIAIVLATQVAFAATAPKKVVTSVAIPGGLKISTTTTVATNGHISGTGQISGPGFHYSFAITGMKTAKNTVILTGHFNVPGNPSFSLTATTPSGRQTFKYSIYGQSFTYAGTGTAVIH